MWFRKGGSGKRITLREISVIIMLLLNSFSQEILPTEKYFDHFIRYIHYIHVCMCKFILVQKLYLCEIVCYFRGGDDITFAMESHQLFN